MREVTERQEGIDAGTALLVGTNRENIVNNTKRLLEDQAFYNHMAKAVNPYGDGKASERILKILENAFN
jgi:UDP-N-acetylglucosamine 2-epimerase (non-hydrolysing)